MRATVKLLASFRKALHVEGEQPFGVVAQGGLLGIEDLEGLVDVGLGVRLDLFGGELRARGVAAGRVADERGAVADDERDAVAEVLELAELAQRHGMPEVDVGGRGVDAQLDIEGLAAFLSFSSSALSGTICAAPEAMVCSCSSADSIDLSPRYIVLEILAHRWSTRGVSHARDCEGGEGGAGPACGGDIIPVPLSPPDRGASPLPRHPGRGGRWWCRDALASGVAARAGRTSRARDGAGHGRRPSPRRS